MSSVANNAVIVVVVAGVSVDPHHAPSTRAALVRYCFGAGAAAAVAAKGLGFMRTDYCTCVLLVILFAVTHQPSVPGPTSHAHESGFHILRLGPADVA